MAAHFPTELYRGIISGVDHQDLTPLLSTSFALRSEAERIFYHTLSFVKEPPTSFARLITDTVHWQRVAPLVHSLCIDLSEDTNVGPLIKQAVQTTTLTHLKHLSIIVPSDLDTLELSPNLPFQLLSFETNLAGFDTLRTFLNSQPTISIFDWAPRRFQDTFFDGLQLPNLTVLGTNFEASVISNMLEGRQIKSLMCREPISRLVDQLQPMPSVEELCSDYLDGIHLLAGVFPNLSWLEGHLHCSQLRPN